MVLQQTDDRRDGSSHDQLLGTALFHDDAVEPGPDHGRAVARRYPEKHPDDRAATHAMRDVVSVPPPSDIDLVLRGWIADQQLVPTGLESLRIGDQVDCIGALQSPRDQDIPKIGHRDVIAVIQQERLDVQAESDAAITGEAGRIGAHIAYDMGRRDEEEKLPVAGDETGTETGIRPPSRLAMTDDRKDDSPPALHRFVDEFQRGKIDGEPGGLDTIRRYPVQAETPKRRPTRAVSAIAPTPQKTTRATDLGTLPPPMRAEAVPRIARATSDTATIATVTYSRGARAAARMGSTAPLAKLTAEAAAACTGRAAVSSDMPSSSRKWAPNLGEFLQLALRILAQFARFQRPLGMLTVGLRAHGDVLARRHGHRAGNEAGHARDHHVACGGFRRGHAHHEARGGEDAVVGAEHRRAQPADAADPMYFAMPGYHTCSSSFRSTRSSRRDTSQPTASAHKVPNNTSPSRQAAISQRGPSAGTS
ncbi:hypothetical protein KCV01_g16257, partial [Aureobasidium melanogenum]